MGEKSIQYYYKFKRIVLTFIFQIELKGYASNGNRKGIHIYNYNKQTSNKM